MIQAYLFNKTSTKYIHVINYDSGPSHLNFYSKNSFKIPTLQMRKSKNILFTTKCIAQIIQNKYTQIKKNK